MERADLFFFRSGLTRWGSTIKRLANLIPIDQEFGFLLFIEDIIAQSSVLIFRVLRFKAGVTTPV